MKTFPKRTVKPKNILDELKLGWATKYDYDKLRKYHYINTKTPHNLTDIFGLFDPKLSRCLGVVAYTHPKIIFGARSKTEIGKYLDAIPKTGDKMRFINANIRYISRFILHPSIRGIGASKKLIQESRKKLKVRWIEAGGRMTYYYNFNGYGSIFSTKIERFNSIDNMYQDSSMGAKSGTTEHINDCMIKYSYELYRNDDVPVKTIRQIMAERHR